MVIATSENKQLPLFTSPCGYCIARCNKHQHLLTHLPLDNMALFTVISIHNVWPMCSSHLLLAWVSLSHKSYKYLMRLLCYLPPTLQRYGIVPPGGMPKEQILQMIYCIIDNIHVHICIGVESYPMLNTTWPEECKPFCSDYSHTKSRSISHNHDLHGVFCDLF